MCAPPRWGRVQVATSLLDKRLPDRLLKKCSFKSSQAPETDLHKADDAIALHATSQNCYIKPPRSLLTVRITCAPASSPPPPWPSMSLLCEGSRAASRQMNMIPCQSTARGDAGMQGESIQGQRDFGGKKMSGGSLRCLQACHFL